MTTMKQEVGEMTYPFAFGLVVKAIIALYDKISSLDSKEARKNHEKWKDETLSFLSDLSPTEKAKLIHTLMLLVTSVAASSDSEKKSAAIEVARIIVGVLDDFFESIECKECPKIRECDHVHDLRETMLRLVDTPDYDDWFIGAEGDEVIEKSKQNSMMN